MRVSARSSIGLSEQMSPLSNVDDVVDRIIAPEVQTLDASKQRRAMDVERNQSLQSYGKLLTDLSNATDRMKRPSDFQKLTAESSRPDLLNVAVDGAAAMGQYEVEISGLAKSSRLLTQGFPDKDKTPVGFGYLTLSTQEENLGVAIPPGSNLSDVAAKINESSVGLRASVINTGANEDGFRLMVTSIATGEMAQVNVDADTTFLDFSTQRVGGDLTATFEGVPVKRETNDLANLIDGVHLRALKADPGSTVSVTVRPDMDKTAADVRDFVQQYNQVRQFAQGRPQVDISEIGAPNGERAILQASRTLQSAVQEPGLAEIGITTDPKTGELRLDEGKLKYSLAGNFDRVADLFTSRGQSAGLAEKMGSAIKKLQDKTSGALGVRLKGMEERIRRQDGEIARKEEQMQNKRGKLAAKFASLNSRIATMNAESDILVQRLGATPSSNST